MNFENLKKHLKLVFAVFIPFKIDKDLNSSFKRKLINDNSRRLFVLFCLILLSQIIFFVLEISSILKWDVKVFVIRIVIISICLIFLLFIYILREKKRGKNSIKYLSLFITSIQIAAILAGSYFVIYMFQDGIYSYSPFLLATFIVSMTCIRKPYFAGLSLIAFFIGLTVIINLIISDIAMWMGEFLIGLVIVVLIYFGNILTYKKNLKLFIQDRQISEQNEKLKLLAQVDELTGIYNRREILKYLDINMALAKRYEACFCVAILDIDHFKRVNDTYGHNTGDDVLRIFSDNIKSMLREADIFGRWGGEEFLIIIPFCKRNSAFLLLERMRLFIESYTFPTVGKVTFSAGICQFNNEKQVVELVEKADSALYKAKESGRNQVQFFKQAIPSTIIK